ncbi:pentapeptide repeat-containing protein [Pseudonocardia hierapolitana]|uniref:pentapeptide repeat-containing protein n=1 Tax=Pseudonocardia hierapolitana TaxID=1128676 RepID=UPI0011BD7B83|nr:pentapeptide repeat-containing protein [Pseudonocardia hierapolitana]
MLIDSSFGELVDLENTSIGANLVLSGSHFRSEVRMLGAELKGTLAIVGARSDDGATVSLGRAEVSDAVSLDRSEFGGAVDITEAVLKNSLLATKATFRDVVHLNSAQIGGDVNLTGAQIYQDVHMSRVRVDGALILAGPQPATWFGEDRTLYLRGTTVKGVDDSKDAWPPRIFMSDFMFDGLRTTGAGSDGLISRSSDWYIRWLRSDPGFCRMAYAQLESSLRAAGRSSEANAVGMDRMAREYSERGVVYPARWLLSPVHRFTVGYGYHPEWVVLWIVCVIGVGAIAARYLPSNAMRRARARSKIIFSTHRLIPLISFGQAYANVDVTSDRVKPWVRRYFYLHSILGYVLAAVLVTAVAGLTGPPMAGIGAE